MTVATDTPAYSPWFIGNNPSNGKGYESAVAYAVAKQLGFATSEVKWLVVPFNTSYAPPYAFRVMRVIFGTVASVNANIRLGDRYAAPYYFDEFMTDDAEVVLIGIGTVAARSTARPTSLA